MSKVSARTAAAAKAKVDMSEVEKKKAALAKLFPDTDIRIGSDETLDIPRISTGSAAYQRAVLPRFSVRTLAVKQHSRSPVSLTYKSKAALRSSLTWNPR